MATSIFYNAFKNEIWESLSFEASSISIAYAYFEDHAELSIFAIDGIRVMLLDEHGNLLYQSHPSGENASELTNAEEVIEAYESGTGRATRTSQTFGSETYYYAILLSDGNVLRIGQDAQTLWTILSDSILMIVLSCLVFLMLAIALSIRLTKRIVAPIMEMTRDLEHIQNNVPYKELSPFISAIYSDRLLRSNNEKIRQEFTANVSHELKSPLTSISGYAELIVSGLAKPVDIPNFATKIHTEAGRMITLVEDIIQLSQLDTMRDSFSENASQFEQVNLYSLGQECLDRQMINAKRAFVSLTLSGDDTFINGNHKLLTELFQNLCDNAIRYNKPGGKVFIEVGRNSNNIAYMKVRDTGIGIPEESQSRIFERFYRVDKSHSKETGGTGLGLAIVKHIALVHDGKLHLESEFGKGTEISVTF